MGWPVTMEDMAYQHSDWVEPISTTYKGYRLYQLPPNGQGMAALEMLNILESDDVRSLGHNSADYLHLLIEAKKLAFADLDSWLADPDRARLPVKRIISKDYGREQRRRIDSSRAQKTVKSGIDERVEFLTRNGDTVYLTVVDKDRNIVSFINSIFWQFGSGVVVPETGIILQNRGALFSLDPEHPNRVEGRKRPYHTIIPALAYRDGKPWMSFGVMGGDMQPQGHVQVLLNMIEFGMNVQRAGRRRCATLPAFPRRWPGARIRHRHHGHFRAHPAWSYHRLAPRYIRRLPGNRNRLGTRRFAGRQRSAKGWRRGGVVVPAAVVPAEAVGSRPWVR
jgi:gamma-glutamyltranspeptidase/glutathione hydrolase